MSAGVERTAERMRARLEAANDAEIYLNAGDSYYDGEYEQEEDFDGYETECGDCFYKMARTRRLPHFIPWSTRCSDPTHHTRPRYEPIPEHVELVACLQCGTTFYDEKDGAILAALPCVDFALRVPLAAIVAARKHAA